MDTVEKLNQLDEFMACKALLELDKQKAIDQVYTQEIRDAVSDIEAEFAIKSEGVDQNIKELTDNIKNDVVNNGATVKGMHLQAVYMKGRVSWDTKALDGYASAHPEIERFRKEGNPSVSIRKLG